jgi:serine/threonine protein phosphatase PrpC
MTTTGHDVAAPQSLSSQVHIDVAARSHTGYKREDNEDHFFVTKISRAMQTLITSLPAGEVPAVAEEVNYLMVVADGMGGHAAGDGASRMAFSTLMSIAMEKPDGILKVDPAHAA